MTTVTDQEKKDAKFQLALAAAGFEEVGWGSSTKPVGLQWRGGGGGSREKALNFSRSPGHTRKGAGEEMLDSEEDSVIPSRHIRRRTEGKR